ncbi:Down syndrome cell adhesion molecule-like protein 1 [Portunus trituberculatus]|uniref:Down syndrome cell adhesion molecule-like protein 1 n=1 Tax=Portunus trituberculatus TaxID=210409 RepID=A0A5B7EI25_PORTR|nr:Down syndrome cell adhesion molecule-like protein 1 [Portunus trituberculatus]
MVVRCGVEKVVAQKYVTRVIDEDVLAGNSAIFKCMIPSFVADFVSVQAWADSEGRQYYSGRQYGAGRLNATPLSSVTASISCKLYS